MNGCRCPQCWGLAEYMQQLTGKDYGLPNAPGCTATLRVLTTGPAPTSLVALDRTCDGSMTCSCPDCEQERAQRVRLGGRDPRQPWDAKKRQAA